MTDKDLIELGFTRTSDSEGYYYQYRLSDVDFFTVSLKNGGWGVVLNDACDTLITELEDLKTVVQIMKKYAKQDNAHLYV